MLNQLQDLSNNFGYLFGYGQYDTLILLAQTLPDDGYAPYLLFHEGFFLADWNQDGQGALEQRHQLKLDICTSSKFTDLPEKRKEHLDALEIEARRIYKALCDMGTFRGVRVEMGVNLTPRNLDAIIITGTLLTPAVSLCKL